jgi:purine-binding chemotaxis protein CheW
MNQLPSTIKTSNVPAINAPEQTMMLVTMKIDNQRFGIPVENVRDVLKNQRIAPIPRAPKDIAGSINLRGRIVTVINLREKLGLATSYSEKPVFVVVDFEDEYFTLLVDSVSEVTRIPVSQMESCPPNLAANWREVSNGICQTKNDLLLIIDTKSLLTP